MARGTMTSRRWRRPFLAVLLTVLVIVTGGAGPGSAGAAPSATGAPTADPTTTTTLPAVPVDPAALPTDRPVREAVREVPPFDMLKGGRWTGYSIELWREIASELDVKYEFVQVGTVGEMLTAVHDGKADLAIGAISITAQRESALDFSLPIYDSGLQIMTRAESSAPRLGSLFTKAVLKALFTVILFVFALIVVVGHIIWLVERRRNDDFPKGYVHGVEAGMWWAIVTLTTVGYGDKTARTTTGRAVAILWMVIGIVVVAQVTAVVTSAATVERLESNVASLADLHGKKVVTVRGTVAAKFLEDERIPARLVDDVATAEDAVVDGTADATFYDAPVLKYFVDQYAQGRAEVVGPLYLPNPYGIALPHGSPAVEPVNRALLTLYENGTVQTIDEHWFGTPD